MSLRFLLASLHMEVLARSHNVKQFKGELKILSTTLEDFYKTVLERIEMQNAWSRRIAINVLTWLTFAERALTTEELAHAIAISDSAADIQFKQERLPVYSESLTVDDLTEHCAGLILVDNQCNTIRLCHHTAQAYLKKEELIVQHARSKIADTCLTCLSCLPVKPHSKIPFPQDEVDEYCKSYPFLAYAAEYWGNHLSSDVQVDGKVYKHAWEFLSNKRSSNAALQFMANREVRYERDVSAMHLAAYFGLVNLVKRAQNVKRPISIDPQTARGRTPLHWSVIHSQGEFLRFLVSQGANMNIQDADGRTVLHLAISRGDMSAVLALLSSEKDVNLEIVDTSSSQRWTPLISAVANGQYKIAKLLLKEHAMVDAQDKDGWTALRWAAQRGYAQMAKLLLSSGASPEPPSNDHWTLLRWAAQEGREDFIKLLTEARVNLNTPIADENGCTALALAVRYGRTMTAWLLIQAGTEVNKPDRNRKTPLHEAVLASENSMLFILLESGADINAQTKHGLTPLHIAASQGLDSAVWLLLQKRAEVTRGDMNDRTPLHLAIMGGYENVVHTLIWRSCGLTHAKDDEGRTALHYAAAYNNVPIAEIVLNRGAYINVRDFGGHTPLHVAVTHEHEKVVGYLLRKGADVRIQNGMKLTAAKLAASTGNKTIIEACERSLVSQLSSPDAIYDQDRAKRERN